MRTTLITTGLAAILLMHTPAHAQTSVADDVITRIEADGYTVTEVKRSWLGRIVIIASNSTDLREVVLNRTSGEVLRDQRFPNDTAEGASRSAPEAASGNRERPGKPDGSDGKGGSDGPGGLGGPGGPGGPGGG
ncbi:hypothetical protein [uncultured Roseobacter sp.]|uniref:hypothetical protein n=1 Tax=uncultured Roseobacter sp. TaxID=114847 RepID=UPI002636928D|nr:hypothetical protein [uncultured Roseobacter sp.]